MEDFKEVEISGQNFQIGRMTPEVGARIGNLLITSILKIRGRGDNNEGSPSVTPTPEEAIEGMWVVATDTLSEENYSYIQRRCLLVCSQRITADSPAAPVLMKDGRWASKELSRDIAAVNSLIAESLKFNLAGFFGQGSKVAGA